MKMKKMLLILLVFAMAGTGAFAQEHKHQPFDVLLGLNLGTGISPNTFGLISSLRDGESRPGSYAFTMDFGLTVDFYFLNWLSVSSGLLLHPDIYALLNQDAPSMAAVPLCLTIPIIAHINIPRVEWLYMGVGVNINIPLVGFLDSVAGTSTKGDTFVGLPIDIGFDFVKPGRGGVRFFFRITPEFHRLGTPVPIGFIWQIYNWKVFSRENNADSRNGKTTYSSNATGNSGGGGGNVTSGGSTGNSSSGGNVTSGNSSGNSSSGGNVTSSSDTGNSGTVTNSTFILTGIPSTYNGKYAILQSSLPIGGAQSINMAADTIILVPIANGSVSIPMWSGINTDNPVRYSGNDTTTVMVTIFNLATTTSSFDVLSPLPLSQIKFNSVTFSKGGATKSWSQGQVQ